ncbi:ABC transporter permease [Brevundimonas sp. SORGH_AS_0993]|uniref:ABC transporter permease n=1 Tax=Brevundimonas sp. SORGH_AS_0993 TaxID=3041794 RepID=UPI0027859792|nr:ABC transporter permease [Brevundimonas sp. SORGH_AS_0993]MDQ1153397.1 putative ABC transport system permease protein [Brevundimonas sp. SORGH_AS_0993]
MTLFKLLAAFIRRRPVTWGFYAAVLAIAVSVTASVLLLEQAAGDRLRRDLGGIDLVIGAKGSPLQLVMSTVFQVDAPTGNIALAKAQRFAANPMVRQAIPISMGDSVGGLRIVGSTLDYPALYQARLSAGDWWSKPMQAVLGATAAERLKLKVGDTFVGEHGLMEGGEKHSASPYRVVGVLAATGAVVDRLVLTDYRSIWEVHAHHHHHDGGAAGQVDQDGDQDEAEDAKKGPEITALLVRYRSPLGAVILPNQVKATPDLQPASPALEAARLNQIAGAGADAIQRLGIALLGFSLVGFVVALTAAVLARRRELALLRALGARPSLLIALTALEGVLLGLVGGLLGLAAARVAVHLIAASASAYALPIPPIGMTDAVLMGLSILLGLLGSLGPAVAAARTNVPNVLGGA